MPEIQYPTNPNTDTAFVVQDDGKKNRALMTAPQDTSTLELPSNANSTKGYVTIDGKKQRVILTADIGGGGSGGTVDYSKTVQKTETMPAADASNAGQVYMYTGATNANFTQNYIYKNVKTATYTGTVSFEAATLSGTTVACSGDNFANFLTESGVEPLSVVSGTMTYDSASALWVLVGKDSDGNTVLTFQEYQQDYEDAGFTFTGTPQDGDVVAFTCTVEEASATYAWTRVDVQPAGATYTAGTGISIDANNEISVTAPTLTNTATGTNALTILGTASSGSSATNVGAGSSATGTGATAFGRIAQATSAGAVAIGMSAESNSSGSIAIGRNAKANATSAIMIAANSGASALFNNTDANTFKVANANGNFEIMSADGTIPADRLTHAINKYSTMPTASASNLGWIVQFTGTTDATYTHGHLYECVSDGADPATYSWTEVSMGGGSSYTAGTGIDITNDVISVTAPTLQNTATGTNSLTISGTATTSASSTNIGIGSSSGVAAVSIGNSATAGGNSVAVGQGSSGGSSNTVVGRGANSRAASYVTLLGSYTEATANFLGGIAIGNIAKIGAENAIQLNANKNTGATNSDANTFKVANANGNFEIMNANGNLPADRLASTTGLADGNYRLRLVMASGVPTLEWVAE